MARDQRWRQERLLAVLFGQRPPLFPAVVIVFQVAVTGQAVGFVQSQVHSVAFTSEKALEMLAAFVHTTSDTPDVIDHYKLVEVAESLAALVCTLSRELS